MNIDVSGAVTLFQYCFECNAQPFVVAILTNRDSSCRLDSATQYWSVPIERAFQRVCIYTSIPRGARFLTPSAAALYSIFSWPVLLYIFKRAYLVMLPLFHDANSRSDQSLMLP